MSVRPVEPMPPIGGGGDQDDEIDLAQYIATLIDARWLILAVTLGATLAGLAYGFVVTPVYRSNVILQIEDKKNGIGGIDELTSMFTGQSPAETEIEIVRSRTLLGSVVKKLNLDISIAPRRLPLIGPAVARRFDGPGIAAAPLGLSQFAWGGERISISALEPPGRLERERLTLRAEEGGRYTLFGPDNEKLVAGEVGKQGDFEAGTIFVAELVARPGTEFRLTKHHTAETITDLQEKLQATEKGKKTGVLLVSLDGPDRNLIVRVLDAIANAYLRQNVDRKSEEAEKTLEFLNTQLPVLKDQLNTAEAALNSYRTSRGSGAVNLTIEAQATIDQVVDVEKKMSELEIQRADLRRLFTSDHPMLASVERQLKQLGETRDQLNGKLKDLPGAELQIARLTRDVRVADELYTFLLNKAQEMRIMKSGTIGNVRIIDTALFPDDPEWPRRGLIGIVALLIGLFAGSGLAFVRKSLLSGVEDPDIIERMTGVTVYANVLHSDDQSSHEQEAKRTRGAAVPILAASNSADPVIESIRSLRTSLQFAMHEAKSNVIAIGGPSPEIGKSFVAVNLAYVMADAGKRILIVDADLRRGKLNRYFGVERTPGLSDMIVGRADTTVAIRATQNENLRFLPSGELPPNPSELLLSERAHRIMDELSARFDIVIIDTPPILAVTDSAIIARIAGVNLMVLRATHHPLREIQLAVRIMRQNGANPNGIVLNDIRRHAGKYGYSRYAYHYHYEYK